PKEIKLGGIFHINDEQTDNIEQLEKLKHFNNWKIIEQNDLTPLFTLLPKSLISEIQKVNGMKILYHSNLSVHMPKGHNILIHHIQKPLEIQTFNNVKIFASVIVLNKKRPYRNVFVVRVEYNDDENPYIVIHRIGPAKKTFNIFIPYMLVGYEEELPIGKIQDDAIAHVCTEKFVSDGNNTIKHPNLDGDYCWLGCPILKCRENPGYEFGRSKYVISYHFCRHDEENDTTQLCCYGYDAQTDKINNNEALTFEVNCAIFTKNTSEIEEIVRPTEYEWNNKEYTIPPFRGRPSRTFTGNKWELFEHPKPIFASIQYSNNPNNPLFLNIHKKYPIAKSLNNIPDKSRIPIGYIVIGLGNCAIKADMSLKIKRDKPLPHSSIKKEHEEKKLSNSPNIIRNTKMDIDQTKKNRNSRPSAINTDVTYDLKSELKIKDIEKCYAKALVPKDKKELFLLKKHIDIKSFQSLPSKLIEMMLTSTNFSSDNSSIDDIYLEIVYPKIEFFFEKKLMQPTDEIIKAMIDALNNKRPYQELIKVFNMYGYILPQKIILGEKLYNASHFVTHKTINSDEYQLEIEESSDNGSLKLDNLFDLWKNEYGVNINYFMATNKEAISKDIVAKWISACSKHDFESLKVINQSELFPLYEMFEESISQKIKSILEKADRKQVLMSGIVQVHDNKYYHINFSDKMDSSEYQVIAKITKVDETNRQIIAAVDEAIVEIKSTTRTGFLVIIENLDKLNTNTRKLSILNAGTKKVEQNQEDLSLEIPKNTEPSSLIILLYESSLPIQLKNKNRNKNGSIKLNIDYSLLNKNNEFENNEPTNNESKNNESKNSESEDDEFEDDEFENESGKFEDESENTEFEISYFFITDTRISIFL
ncbi:18660_t:CDS:2, partial [Dentiscutata erythropus]